MSNFFLISSKYHIHGHIHSMYVNDNNTLSHIYKGIANSNKKMQGKICKNLGKYVDNFWEEFCVKYLS